MNKDDKGPQHASTTKGWTPGDLTYYEVPQNWSDYTDEEHVIWHDLYNRQMEILPGRATEAFFQGLKDLGITNERIPDFKDVNEKLSKLTGWTIIGVPGLIPAEPFFEMLSNKIFPVGTFIRSREQFDYIQEPDIFHDLYGHVPLLTNPDFANYMQAYGRGGLKASKLKASNQISRLYWHTVEFGLVKSEDGLRIFGAGILSSPTESVFCLEDPSPHRIQFDIERIMRSHYFIDDFQDHYFVIDSFEDLVAQTKPDFTPIYEAAKSKEIIAPPDTVPEDVFIHKGTGVYAIEAQKRREERGSTGGY